MSELGIRTGTVASFDEARGLGVIRGHEGTEWPFHCTQISDGSRQIDEGAEVSFTVIAGRAGRWEAGSITRR